MTAIVLVAVSDWVLGSSVLALVAVVVVVVVLASFGIDRDDYEGRTVVHGKPRW